MIIDFSHDVDTYHELLAHYGKWSYACPVCKSVGEWQRHGSYKIFRRKPRGLPLG